MYPVLGKFYYRYRQAQFISSVSSNAVQEYGGLADVFENESAPAPSAGYYTPMPSSVNTLNPSPSPQPLRANIPTPKPGELLGTLYIDKFGLELKIVEGASEQNLEFFIGHLAGTSAIGEIGNTAIAGHRSYVFGNFFNRLDELEKDDEIKIEANGKTYIYKVYETLVVEPNDISVLKRSRTQSVLTLITCHPLYISSHRLIIHAVQIV
jgi:sortase A